ncbi:MAG: TetR/AcrR family transcriptional regulator, partial [Anaerolineales bacterium]
QPLDEATIPVLASVIWIISENWLAFLELEGKNVSRKNVRAGTRLILQVIKPYLSPEAITEISE